MNELSIITAAVAHAFTWALIHSLWQGVVIYLLMRLILQLGNTWEARMKYHLSLAALCLLCLWFANTLAANYIREMSKAVTFNTIAGEGGHYRFVAAAANSAGVADGTLIGSLQPTIDRYFVYILYAYVLGLIAMLFRFSVQAWSTHKLRSNGVSEVEPEWVAFIENWSRKLGITRTVQLVFSSRTAVPLMMGVLKPIIILPISAATQLSVTQIESILLHELAHIKRYDYLVGVFQALAETILFFNPFVWLVSGHIRREREHCCDDVVVAATANPLPYAHALAILATNKQQQTMALAATGNKHLLLHRIKRIMEPKQKTNRNNRLAYTVTATAVAAFGIALIAVMPSFAQKANTKKETIDTAKKAVYRYKTVTVDASGKRTETDKTSDKPMDRKPLAGANTTTVQINVSDETGEQKKFIHEIAMAAGEVAAAVGSIDLTELREELEKAAIEMKEVDWQGISEEIKKALQEVNEEIKDSKLHKEIRIEVRRGLEQAKKDLEQAKKEMESARKEQRKTSKVMVKASVSGDDDNPPTPPNYEPMLDQMQQDGLINREEAYSIEKKGDVLLINGKEQPASVKHKYKEHLLAKTISIKGNKGTLNILVDN